MIVKRDLLSRKIFYTLIPTATVGECGEPTAARTWSWWDSPPAPRRDNAPAASGDGGFDTPDRWAAANEAAADRGLDDASGIGDDVNVPRKAENTAAVAAEDEMWRRNSEGTPPPPNACEPPPAANASAPVADGADPECSGGLERDARSTRARADADAASPDEVVGRELVPDRTVRDPASAAVSLQSSMTERRLDCGRDSEP